MSAKREQKLPRVLNEPTILRRIEVAGLRELTRQPIQARIWPEVEYVVQICDHLAAKTGMRGRFTTNEHRQGLAAKWSERLDSRRSNEPKVSVGRGDWIRARWRAAKGARRVPEDVAPIERTEGCPF